MRIIHKNPNHNFSEFASVSNLCHVRNKKAHDEKLKYTNGIAKKRYLGVFDPTGGLGSGIPARISRSSTGGLGNV